MKQTRFLMGIDNGGSNIKCAIFDLNGEEIIAASTMPPTSQPSPGIVERDPEHVWSCNCTVISEVLRKSGIHPNQIAAISLCGYGGGACLVDACGTSVYPIIVSTDTRAHKQMAFLRDTGIADQVFNITHQQPWEGQPVALLRWFRENRPDVLSRTRYFLTIKDYIRSRLTHEVSTELTDASNNNLIDPTTRSYSEHLFRFSDLSDLRTLFDAPLLSSTEIAGFVTAQAAESTGLAPGTPVVAGLYDVSSCTLGCGALESGTLAITNGTWSMASYFGTEFARASDSTIVTVSPLANRFLLEQGSATGTINLNWYLDQFIAKMNPDLSKDQLYKLCADVVKNTNPKNDIVFVPYLYASNTTSGAKGAFFNLIGYHNENDLLYAVMEGILLSAQHHIKLLEQGGSLFQHARLSGGISSSHEWSQMFCDLLQMPISIMKGSQQGARGAAMCAGVAVGEFASVEEAAIAMSHPALTLYPRTKYAELYREKTKTFEKALQSLNYFQELK